MASAPGVWTHDIPNRSPAFIIVTIVFVAITTLFFAFRQIWRWQHRQRGLDDVMATAAYITLLVQSVMGGISAHYGFGKHLQDIRMEATTALLYFYIYQVCYKLLGGLTKLTFLALYLRIFNPKGFHQLIWVVAVIVSTGSLAFTLGTVFQCSPIHRAWDRRVSGTCINNTGFWFTHAAFNTFWDIIIYLMPIPLIRTLKLARGQKTGLISIFGLGAFVIAASIVRMVMLRSSAKTTDPTWGSADALMWTEVEANTSVICCCLPALRVLLLDFWRYIKGSKGTTTSTTDHSGRPKVLSKSSATPAHDALDHPFGPQRSDTLVVPSTATRDSRGGNESWYDRMLQSISKDDASRGSSQDIMVDQMELGAIYKRTDMHVSSQDLGRRGEGRTMGLKEILNER